LNCEEAMRMTFTFYVCLSLKTESWTLGWTFQPRPPTNRPSIPRIFLVFSWIYAARVLAIGFFTQLFSCVIELEIRITDGGTINLKNYKPGPWVLVFAKYPGYNDGHRVRGFIRPKRVVGEVTQCFYGLLLA